MPDRKRKKRVFKAEARLCRYSSRSIPVSKMDHQQKYVCKKQNNRETTHCDKKNTQRQSKMGYDNHTFGKAIGEECGLYSIASRAAPSPFTIIYLNGVVKDNDLEHEKTNGNWQTWSLSSTKLSSSKQSLSKKLAVDMYIYIAEIKTKIAQRVDSKNMEQLDITAKI